MCFNTDYERDFYSVEVRNGEKVVHLLGFLWLHDEGYWVHEEMSAVVPVSSYSASELDAAQCAVTHYWEELADEGIRDFVNEYYDGEPGTHLPLNEVNEETKEGTYWCRFEEE